MMTAGVSLLLTTTVAFIAIIAKKSTKVGGHGDDNGDEDKEDYGNDAV